MKRPNLLFLCILLSIIRLSAQTDFDSRHEIIRELHDIQFILSGDLDNDADDDILFGYGGKMVWYENEKGAFTTQHIIETDNWIYEATIDDMDNDGDMDIVVAGLQLAIYINDGYGNFVEYIFFDNKMEFRHVATGDLDSDNRKDIVVGPIFHDTLYWFKNEGISFKSHIPKRTIHIDEPDSRATVSSLYLIDFDKNGTNDLIINGEYYNYYWYKNDGKGGFTKLPFIKQTNTVYNFLIVDLDQDGDYDIVGNWKKPMWFTNDGSNFFSTYHLIVSPVVGEIKAADDINGDGYIDLVFNSSQNNLLAWYRNKGDQTFEGPNVICGMYPAFFESCLPIDIDNDGDKDIIADNYYNNQIVVYENTGSGVFRVKQTISDFGNIGIYFSIDDMDQDGDNDIVFTFEYCNEGIYLIENGANGLFNVPEKISDVSTERVILADINNDGLKDIIGVGHDLIFWLRNRGANEFENPVFIDYSFGDFRKAATTDLDGNGFQDLLISSDDDHDGGSLYWYSNTEAGFNHNKTVIVPDSVFNFYTDDMDGDGLADIIVGCSNDSLYLLANTGDAAFDVYRIITGEGKRRWAATDFDGDGLKDIISSYYFCNEKSRHVLGWYRNRGGNEFDPIRQLGDYYEKIRSLYVNDLDLDGDPDIICGNNIYYNDGTGNILKRVHFWNSEQSAAQDMDGDGDADIVCTYEYGYSLFWYQNLLNTCDTVYSVICRGDSLKFFDAWLFDPGIYQHSAANQYNGFNKIVLLLETDTVFPAEPVINGPVMTAETETEHYSVTPEKYTEYYWGIENGDLQSLIYQTQADIKWRGPGMGNIEVYAIKTRSGCHSRSSLSVDVRKKESDEIIICPNPAHGQAYITSTWDPVTVEIFNTMGRIVILTTNEKPVDVSFLSAGLYIVSLKDASGKQLGWRKMIVIGGNL